MLGKINELSTMAYVKATMLKQKAVEAGKHFMEDEQGLSGVVVAVMLILIAVLLIAALWGGLSKWLGDMWEKIVGSSSGMDKPTWSS